MAYHLCTTTVPTCDPRDRFTEADTISSAVSVHTRFRRVAFRGRTALELAGRPQTLADRLPAGSVNTHRHCRAKMERQPGRQRTKRIWGSSRATCSRSVSSRNGALECSVGPEGGGAIGGGSTEDGLPGGDGWGAVGTVEHGHLCWSAEADGNRTRQADNAGLIGFEDRGGHQYPRHLPVVHRHATATGRTVARRSTVRSCPPGGGRPLLALVRITLWRTPGCSSLTSRRRRWTPARGACRAGLHDAHGRADRGREARFPDGERTADWVEQTRVNGRCPRRNESRCCPWNCPGCSSFARRRGNGCSTNGDTGRSHRAPPWLPPRAVRSGRHGDR